MEIKSSCRLYERKKYIYFLEYKQVLLIQYFFIYFDEFISKVFGVRDNLYEGPFQ